MSNYKKLPRGFEPISERRDRLMRHAALTVSLETKMPKEAAEKTFPAWCAKHWRKMLPIRTWLLSELG